MAQVFSTPQKQVGHIVNATSRFMWHATLFNIPLTTLKISSQRGGMDLIDFASKCPCFFLLRCKEQSDMSQYFTATGVPFSPWRIPLSTDPEALGILAYLFSVMGVS